MTEDWVVTIAAGVLAIFNNPITILRLDIGGIVYQVLSNLQMGVWPRLLGRSGISTPEQSSD
jgi:hypothetical protein